MTPAEIKDFARIEPQSVMAFEVDLNDDGEKEIVGYGLFNAIPWYSRVFLVYFTVTK